eukprot:16433486-Heterocapsa_arctica.AAC.1
MRLAANAEGIARLAYSNKEQEAEMSSLHHDHRLSARIWNCTKQGRSKSAESEHDEQVRHAELKETKLKAETHNLASADDALEEQMRYAQHATIRGMEARHQAQLLEERRVAEHAA